MDPFIGQIAICAFPFAPAGWALCDGKTLPIAQNQALNALLGTTFGGDGKTIVGLPDLQGRTPVHRDYRNPDYVLGAKKGVESVTLTEANVPVHNHVFCATTTTAIKANAAPTGKCVLAASAQNLYVTPQSNGSDLQPMDTKVCSSFGAGGAHNNMQPSLAVNFMIAITGLWPARN